MPDKSYYRDSVCGVEFLNSDLQERAGARGTRRRDEFSDDGSRARGAARSTRRSPAGASGRPHRTCCAPGWHVRTPPLRPTRIELAVLTAARPDLWAGRCLQHRRFHAGARRHRGMRCRGAGAAGAVGRAARRTCDWPRACLTRACRSRSCAGPGPRCSWRRRMLSCRGSGRSRRSRRSRRWHRTARRAAMTERSTVSPPRKSSPSSAAIRRRISRHCARTCSASRRR